MDVPEETAAKSYRELASKCRDMAARSPRPGNLVMLAEHYETIAARLSGIAQDSDEQ